MCHGVGRGWNGLRILGGRQGEEMSEPAKPNSLAEELVGHHEDIVRRWYDAWRRSARPHLDVGEAALKNMLGPQLELIGMQLRDLRGAEKTKQMWRITERLDPETRVGQDIAIEEVVEEYRLAVDTVREWIEERGTDVPFKDYSYFFNSIFELVGESVRRYAKQQASRVSEGRRQYLAGVLHQLKTPLTTMAMQLGSFSRRPDLHDDPGFARLTRSTQRMRFLVDGVLRIERFDPDELPVRPRAIDAHEFLEALMGDFEHEARRKRLRFEARVSRALTLHLDPDLLSDALGNVIQNAVRLTSEGFVVVRVVDQGDTVVFEVRDSGPGIPPERLRTLFTQRQPASAGGVGIGLLVAQHAVQALHGSIEVESAVEHGSIFRVIVPRAVAPRNGEPTEQGAPVEQ